MSSSDNSTIHRVRIIDAAIGESRVQGRPTKVIRGTLMPDFFGAIEVPWYQRVAMKNEKHDELVDALAPEGIGVPDDLLLCARSVDVKVQGASELILPVQSLFLLDGHQRFAAAMARIARKQQSQPFGVKILLGTTEEEEVRTFYQVNRMQTKVSTDVLLRNSGSNAAIEALQHLAKTDEQFPQVQWDQLKREGDLIKAHMLYEVAVVLHGYSRGGKIEEILDRLEEIVGKIGTDLLVENVRSFFGIVRTCFGKDELQPFMYRIDLLRGLAGLFSTYQNFWDVRNPNKLLVRVEDIRKLGTLKKRTIEKDLEKSGAAAALRQTLRHHLEKARDAGLQMRTQD